uniref:Uncharacterized protein n=1 Tax=Triticum urartu TaxID=4572 RepID=A0A8R7QBP3_TRIUA
MHTQATALRLSPTLNSGAVAAACTTLFAPATRWRFPGLSPRRCCFFRVPLVTVAPSVHHSSDEQRPAAHCRSTSTRCSTKRLQDEFVIRLF